MHAHRYRGQRWYVLHDATNGRSQRLSRAAYALVGRMNGAKTADAIWREAFEELGDDAPTQDEAIRVLGMLHAADALQCGVTPDLAEMFERNRRREQQEGWRRFLNPVMLRLPLADPDHFLERGLPWVAPLFDRRAAVSGGCALLVAALFALANLGPLARDARSLLWTGTSFGVLAIVYPLMKLVHELAHGFAAKRSGAEVHEAGVTLLLGMPIPYVDASGSAVFPSKGRRIAVSLAGVAAEIALSALALLVWWAVEPGLIKGLCAQVFFMGTLWTLLFNGNPLIKFDAYYALVDWLEIPNLSERAKAYLRYVIERHGYGLADARNPVFEQGERPWLVAYALASSAYRYVLVLLIAWLISGLSPFLGLGLAAVWIGVRLGLPTWRSLVFVLTSPRLSARRLRAVGLSAGTAGGLALLVLWFPLPHRSFAQGVVWPPDSAQLRPDSDGLVVEILAAPGRRVRAAQPLLRLNEPLARAKVEAHEARVAVLRRERQVERQRDRLRSRGLAAEIEVAQLALTNARERLGASVVRSPSPGIFLLSDADDWLGRFVKKGTRIGYVVDHVRPTIRVALTQAQIKRVRESSTSVEVRIGASPGAVEPASVLRQTPGATHVLPSPVLGLNGGGPWPTAPFDDEGVRTDTPVFQLELELERPRFARVGERVHVRFDHGSTSLAKIGFEALSDLLLSRVGG